MISWSLVTGPWTKIQIDSTFAVVTCMYHHFRISSSMQWRKPCLLTHITRARERMFSAYCGERYESLRFLFSDKPLFFSRFQVQVRAIHLRRKSLVSSRPLNLKTLVHQNRRRNLFILISNISRQRSHRRSIRKSTMQHHNLETYQMYPLIRNH